MDPFLYEVACLCGHFRPHMQLVGLDLRTPKRRVTDGQKGLDLSNETFVCPVC